MKGVLINVNRTRILSLLVKRQKDQYNTRVLDRGRLISGCTLPVCTNHYGMQMVSISIREGGGGNKWYWQKDPMK